MKISTLFLAVILVGYVKCGDIAWVPCPAGTKGIPSKKLMEIKHTYIRGCSVQPCGFNKGETQDIVMHLVFYGVVKGLNCAGSALLPIGPLPLLKQDLCKSLDSGSSCDNIKSGTKLRVKLSQKIESFYPTFSGEIRLVIRDDNNTPLFCGQMEIKIQNAGDTDSSPPEDGGGDPPPGGILWGAKSARTAQAAQAAKSVK